MSSAFEGFSAGGLEFLHELGTQDKAWFDANRRTYDTTIVAPTKAFVATIGERLATGMAPGITAQPKTNGSISPINNDLRFSPDKSPYKDHLLLRFWEGDNKKTAPTLMVRISAEEIGFATGTALPDLDRWRHLIDDDDTGTELANALTELGQGRTLDIAGQGYKRVPKPYAEDHPRADLLRHKMFQARWAEPLPSSANDPGLVDYCIEQLEQCADIHHWLVANLS
ncbi:MAG: DUF2461 domain-containing protein [Actinomycetia bacterium]|nr:DUF2461 domain-containing protein [Actinomycetes bacterium]